MATSTGDNMSKAASEQNRPARETDKAILAHVDKWLELIREVVREQAKA